MTISSISNERVALTMPDLPQAEVRTDSSALADIGLDPIFLQRLSEVVNKGVPPSERMMQQVNSQLQGWQDVADHLQVKLDDHTLVVSNQLDPQMLKQLEPLAAQLYALSGNLMQQLELPQDEPVGLAEVEGDAGFNDKFADLLILIARVILTMQTDYAERQGRQTEAGFNTAITSAATGFEKNKMAAISKATEAVVSSAIQVGGAAKKLSGLQKQHTSITQNHKSTLDLNKQAQASKNSPDQAAKLRDMAADSDRKHQIDMNRGSSTLATGEALAGVSHGVGAMVATPVDIQTATLGQVEKEEEAAGAVQDKMVQQTREVRQAAASFWSAVIQALQTLGQADSDARGAVASNLR